MKIIHVVNKCTHTSIPLEIASKMSESNEVIILSLYDSEIELTDQLREIAPKCQFLALNFNNNRFKAIKNLNYILKMEQPDIIHTHHTLSGVIARAVAFRYKRIKVIHTVHGSHKRFGKINNFLIGITLPICDAIVYNSEQTQKSLFGWQRFLIRNKRNIVIYNGIDTKRIISASCDFADALMDRYNVSTNDIVIVQVGRLEKVKNPIATIIAVEKLINRYKDVANSIKLFLVGDGSERGNIEKYIETHPILKNTVILTGTIKRDEVYSLLHRANIMVVPSFSEGFCNALFEGMTCGVNLVVSDIEVFHELIKDEYGIRKFNPNNYDEYANVLHQSIISITEFDGTYVQKIAVDKFDIDICISKYLKLCKELSESV